MKFAIALLLCFLISSQSAVLPGSEKKSSAFVPPDGKVLLIIGQDNQTIRDYMDSFGKIPAGFMTYTNIHYAEGLCSPATDYGSGIHHAQELINEYPGTVLQIGVYMVDILKDIYEGGYDEKVVSFADWLNEIEAPVYLRIGYEFDGPHNRYDPEEYKKAYHYIVDKFRDCGVSNVA